VFLLAFPVVRLVRPFHPWPPRTPGPRWGRGAGARHVVRSSRASGQQSLRAQSVTGQSRLHGVFESPTDCRMNAYQRIWRSLARFSDRG
jgi:hypothetical protein